MTIEDLQNIRLAFRGFANGALQFEESVTVKLPQLDTIIPQLAEAHARSLANHTLHYIEIEFLDEPDPEQRFFRIGTDPSHMVMPIAISLGKEEREAEARPRNTARTT